MLVDATTDDPSIPSVVPDEVGGALTAVRELTAHGHREIGFLNNAGRHSRHRLTFGGFHGGGWSEAGMPVLARAGDRRDGQFGGRLPGGVRVFSTGRARPTRLFCFNDRMAMGAYQAAADLGIADPARTCRSSGSTIRRTSPMGSARV